MDILGVFRVIFGFILVLFIPGYALSWAFFPRKEELGFMERMAISFVLSIASVMLSVLFIDLVLGVDTTPENIVITILAVTGLAAAIWKLEMIYLKSNLKQRIDGAFADGVITIDISNIKRKFKAGFRAIFEKDIPLASEDKQVELSFWDRKIASIFGWRTPRAKVESTKNRVEERGVKNRFLNAFSKRGKGEKEKELKRWERELAEAFGWNKK